LECVETFVEFTNIKLHKAFGSEFFERVSKVSVARAPQASNSKPTETDGM
jgi:hypothetical protein